MSENEKLIYTMCENLWQTLNAVRYITASGKPLGADQTGIIKDVLEKNNPSKIYAQRPEHTQEAK